MHCVIKGQVSECKIKYFSSYDKNKKEVLVGKIIFCINSLQYSCTVTVPIFRP